MATAATWAPGAANIFRTICGSAGLVRASIHQLKS